MVDKNITKFLVKFMEDLEINTMKWEDQIKNCLSDDLKSKSVRKKVGFHFLQFLISAAFDKSMEESVDGYDYCTKTHDDKEDVENDYHNERDLNVEINNDILEVNKTEMQNMPIHENGFWNNVNNPILLTNYLDSGRVDTNLTITTSQRNEDQLIYSNHIFAKKSYTPSILDDGRGIFKWRCVLHAGKKPVGPCKGQVATTIDGLCVLLDSVTEHNHLPDITKIQGILYRQRLKTIALNHPHMKTSEILSSAEMLLAGSNNHRNVIKDEKSLHRFIQRVRAKNSIKGTSMDIDVDTSAC